MNKFKKYAPYIVVGLAVLSLIMLFVEPGMTASLMGFSDNLEVSAFNVIFGIEEGFSLNVLGLITILLIIGGAVLPFIKNETVFNVVAAVMLVLAGILMFLVPSATKFIEDEHGFEPLVKLKPAWPMIISGMASIFAGLTQGVKVYLEMKH